MDSSSSQDDINDEIRTPQDNCKRRKLRTISSGSSSSQSDINDEIRTPQANCKRRKSRSTARKLDYGQLNTSDDNDASSGDNANYSNLAPSCSKNDLAVTKLQRDENTIDNNSKYRRSARLQDKNQKAFSELLPSKLQRTFLY